MLKKRLQTAIPLICFLVLAFFLPGFPGRLLFTILALLMLLLAIREGFHLTDAAGRPAFLGLTAVYGIALVTNGMLWKSTEYLEASLLLDNIITLCFLFAAFAMAFHREPDSRCLKSILTSLALGIYICWPLSYMPKIYNAFPDGPALLFAMIVICKMADIGGYFLGSLSSRLPGGNHKICRPVSPGKSWEGLFGGMLFSTATAAIFHHFGYAGGIFTTDSVWLLGLSIPLIGLLGDLAESVIKRAVNVKDSGNVPGLGGVLDMLDSLIPCAPFFFYYLVFALRSGAQAAM